MNPYAAPKSRATSVDRPATLFDVQLVQAVAIVHVVFGLYLTFDGLLSDAMSNVLDQSIGSWIGRVFGTVMVSVLAIGIGTSLWRLNPGARTFLMVWDSLWFVLVVGASVYRFAVLSVPPDINWFARGAGGLFAGASVIFLLRSRAFRRPANVSP